MRVLLLTDSKIFAGTERHIIDLAFGLRNEGVDAAIGCPPSSTTQQQAVVAGIPVISIPAGPLIHPAAIRTLRHLLNTGEVDILHAHNGRTILSGGLACTLARRGRLVGTQHFLEPEHLAHTGMKGFLFRLAHWWVDWRTDHFIAISQAVREGMLSHSAIPPGKISVVLNGVPPPEVSHQAAPERLRQEWGMVPGAPVIVCVARLEQEKDVSSLITAMQHVVKIHPEAQCVIAGDGAQKEALARQIEQEGLVASVRLLGFRPDALAVISAGDLFVLPSLAEPFGLVLIEAMALGKPVIATCAGGPKEIVLEGETGLLVAPGNPHALAAAILQLVSDRAARHRMGECGLRRYQQHFTSDKMAVATLEVYKRVTG